MRSFKKTLAKLLAFIACVLLITELVTEPYFQNEVFQYQDSAVRDTYGRAARYAHLRLVPCLPRHHAGGFGRDLRDQQL